MTSHEQNHLVVVTGWTGAGKSTIANALGADLSATVVSFDWVMSGLRVFPELWERVEGAKLSLDAVNPLSTNLNSAITHVREPFRRKKV